MADVNVNIRGRDDGLGGQLDGLREKVKALGRDVAELNNISEKTPTAQKRTVEREAQGALGQQTSQIRSEYNEARQANVSDFREQEKKFASGEINQKQFDKQKEMFSGSQQDLGVAEKKEILIAEKEMNRHLRLIVREMIDKRKLTREKAQRDKKEFEEGGKGGTYGALVSDNKELQKQKLTAGSQDEVADINAKIEANKARMREMDNTNDGKSPSGGPLAGAGAGALGVGGALAGGNLGGAMAQSGSTAVQMAGGSGQKAAAAAGLIAIAYAALSQSSKTFEAGSEIGAMRGSGYQGSTQGFSLIDRATSGTGMGTTLGMGPDEFLKAAAQKARSTGIAGPNILDRTKEDLEFKRAYGADVSGFDQFERFTKAGNSNEATDIALDMLNVLTSINESSLKEGDLATLGEKMQTTQTLMNIQRSKRDLVDVDASLRMMAAFESIGLSQKGDKAGDFLSQTIQGLGEGGGDNMQLMKYEAAKRAHPELAYNPAELRRFVRFNSDDPDYINSFMKMAGDYTGGNQMAQDDLLYSFFNPQSEADMEIYEKAMSGQGDFSALMTGAKGIDKSRKGSLSKGFASAESDVMMGGVSEGVAGLQAVVSGIGTAVENFFTGNTVKVDVTNDFGTMPVAPVTKGVRKNGN